ncbi:MAG: BofC C-terminal domain-containing protein [Alicyclobacillaceae bacterium]|nr:BofC C-terminal domain-containing protein [Alicyclobacillaceae bacterium]
MAKGTKGCVYRRWASALAAAWFTAGSAGVCSAASPLYLPTFGAFVPGQEVLYVTEYTGGVVRMAKGRVEDLAEPAFSAPGARWSLDGGLTVVSNVPVLRRTVVDVPGDAKGHLFFGLTPESRLILYEGRGDGKNVVRDFGRLDLIRAARGLPQGALESLKRGIRIDSREDYMSVLSTYAEYLEN